MSHDGEIIDFYGQLRSIVELQYNSSGGIHRSVVLFRCDWFELGSKKIETLLSNMMATSKASTLQGAGIRVIPLF